MLQINKATFGFNHNLFEDLSFTVNPGEIVKISGGNDAGKTTLFNCIS
jgi:ABC-type multidrug transport system ATPase subunit